MISIDEIKLSSDNKILAMLLSKDGSDWKTARLLDMETKELLNDTVDFIKYSHIYWYNNGFFIQNLMFTILGNLFQAL